MQNPYTRDPMLTSGTVHKTDPLTVNSPNSSQQTAQRPLFDTPVTPTHSLAQRRHSPLYTSSAPGTHTMSTHPHSANPPAGHYSSAAAPGSSMPPYPSTNSAHGSPRKAPLRVETGHPDASGINVSRTRPLPSPRTERATASAYPGQQTQQSHPLMRMPVPEIPVSVQDQLHMQQAPPQAPHPQALRNASAPAQAGHHLPNQQYGQHSAPQYAGSQYGGSQYTGSQYPGPQLAGSQFTGPQYTGPQYADYTPSAVLPNPSYRNPDSSTPSPTNTTSSMQMPFPSASPRRVTPGARQQTPPTAATSVSSANSNPTSTTAPQQHQPHQHYPTTSGTSPSNVATAATVPVATTATTAQPPHQVHRNWSVTSKHRRFGSDAGVPSSDLTIDKFETIRRQAATQPHDPRTQLELAKRLCEASDHLAGQYTDPLRPSTMEVDPRQQALNREAWTAQSVKIAKRLATKLQYPEALFFLGSIYSSGKYGVDMDYIKALEYYQKAAKLEHAEACYRVAVCEEVGVGTRRNIDKAVSWYKKAAMLGSVASMYKLGMLSLLGSLDQPRDFNTGLMWLQRAADKADPKNPHAVHELALLYERSPLSTYVPGDGIPHSEAKALEHYYIAAKLGYAPSEARLGRAFEFGELGCSVDPSWSISWYSQAAQQGDSDAELGMAGWYWTGSPSLRKNDTEAFLWAERAASQGNPRAMFAVGYFCEIGIGVHRDLTRSKKWYSLAAEKKHPRATQKLKTMD